MAARLTPIRVAPPPTKFGLRNRLMLALADAGLISEYRGATLRWLRHNIEQPRVCDCGKPGTVTVRHPEGGHMGATPPVYWRCDDHADIALTVAWAGRKPLINQTRDECSWRTGSLITKRVTDCGCETHIGEPIDRR